MRPLSFEALSGLLPSLKAETVAVLNRLAGTEWLFEATPTGEDGMEDAPEIQPVTLSFAPWSRQPDGFLLRLDFRMQAGRFSLIAETGLVDLFCDLFLPGWRDEDPESLPVEWRAILSIEAWLQRVLPSTNVLSLEAALIAALPLRDGPDTRLEALVGVAGQAFPCLVGLEDVSRATALFDAGLPAARNLNAFQPPLCYRVLLPPFSMPVADISRLRRNDLILGRDLTEEGFEVLIAIDGGHWLAGALGEAGRVVISADQRRQALMSNIDWGDPQAFDDMPYEDDNDNERSDAVQTDEPGDDGLDDLPVRVEVVLGSGQLSLSQLRQLGEGAVLPGDLDLSAPVTILANGRAMAKGYLVRIDDRIAVQIRGFSRQPEDEHV